MGMDVGGAEGGLKNDINITPLVDVVLVLLIIFMVITPMLQEGAPLVLPNALHPSEQKKEEKHILISVTGDGRVHLGEKARWVLLEILREQLQDKFERNPDYQIFVRGDKTLEFGEMKNVLRVVQDIGFKQVGLVAQHVDLDGNPVTGSVAG